MNPVVLIRMPSCVAATLVLLLASSELSAQQGTAITDSLGIQLQLLPAGRFEMGEHDAAPGFEKDHTGFNIDDERPLHPVVLTQPFYLARAEVTIAQFRAFTEATGYRTTAERSGNGIVGWDPTPPADLPDYQWAFRQKPKFNWRNPGFAQGDDHPVIGVSWDDAQAFCEWLSAEEGASYRLPSEAEWEYACRAGTTSYFSFGDAYRGVIQRHANIGNAELERVAPRRATRQWIFDPDIEPGDAHPFTAPVASYEANPWGLHDLHGNVWEWCADRYLDTWYAQFDRDGYQQPRRRAVDPLCDQRWNEHGDWRAIRGGSWFTAPRQARSSGRGYFEQQDAACYLGFRVARDAPAELVQPARTAFAASEAARAVLERLVGPFREERDGRLQIRLRFEQINGTLLQALREMREPVDLQIDGQGRFSATQLTEIAQTADLRGLSLSNPAPGLSDADFAPLAPLSGLEVLQISGTPGLTDAVLLYLSDMQRLQRLEVQGDAITDAGLIQLPALQRLERLQLQHTLSEGAVLARCSGSPLESASFGRLTDANAELLQEFPRLQSLQLQGCPLTGRGLQSIVSLPRLRDLDLSGCRDITDAEFGPLVEARRLATLNLGGTQAGDAAAEAIQSLNQINNLHIGSDQLTDPGLQRLCLAVSLEHLYLSRDAVNVTDAGFSDLWRLQRLRSLYVFAPLVDGSGLAALHELPQLAALTLSTPELTDDALRHAAACRNLERINLGDWQPGGPPLITDEGLLALDIAPRLTQISLFRANTRITDDALSRLRQSDSNLRLDVHQ